MQSLLKRFGALLRGIFWHQRQRRNDSQIQSDGEFLRKLAKSSRGQWRRIALVGVVFWGLYALILGSGGTVHYHQLKDRAFVLAQTNQVMVAKRDSLDRFIAGFEAGSEALLEKVAREKFQFVRPNERIYRLPTD